MILSKGGEEEKEVKEVKRKKNSKLMVIPENHDISKEKGGYQHYPPSIISWRAAT